MRRNSRKCHSRLSACVIFLLSAGLVIAPRSEAHTQPTNIVLLDVTPEKVEAEIRIPLSELELAFGQELSESPDGLIEPVRSDLASYVLAHVHAFTLDGRDFTQQSLDISLNAAAQSDAASFQEFIIHLDLLPPPDSSTRNFRLGYDLIMHQVPTNRAFVYVRNDWEGGLHDADAPNEVGVIALHAGASAPPPLDIDLSNGNAWHGFTGMVLLGMVHIREGTDHLLFLLTLLLPAPLVFRSGVWREYGGIKHSIVRLLRIITAFTVGHSLTLLIGALGWVKLPQQPVEVLIAISILVSAGHAIRPLFPGKEIFVAAGFGLVHGLAFATVISGFDLGAGPLALSIFGFNIGIEAMQLIVIAAVIPWLILLAKTQWYLFVRYVGGAFAGIAAIGWIVERVSGRPNFVGSTIQSLAPSAYLGIIVIALISVMACLRDSTDDT